MNDCGWSGFLLLAFDAGGILLTLLVIMAGRLELVGEAVVDVEEIVVVLGATSELLVEGEVAELCHTISYYISIVHQDFQIIVSNIIQKDFLIFCIRGNILCDTVLSIESRLQ